MRRFATVPAILLGLAAIWTGASFAAPEQTRAAGLDFWNYSDEATRLQGAKTEGQELESVHEQMRQRVAVSDHIATSLCEDRSTLPEAIESIAALAQSAPDWFAHLRNFYAVRGDVPSTATDRDVIICFLRAKLGSMLLTAEQLGDTSRAAVLSARLARFEEEVHRQSPAPPTQRRLPD